MLNAFMVMISSFAAVFLCRLEWTMVDMAKGADRSVSNDDRSRGNTEVQCRGSISCRRTLPWSEHTLALFLWLMTASICSAITGAADPIIAPAITSMFFAAGEDLASNRIPNFYTACIFWCGLFEALPGGSPGSRGEPGLPDRLISFFVCLTVLLIIAALSKGGFGMGDVKLISASSLLLGAARTFSVFCVAVLLTSVFSLAMILIKVLRRHQWRKSFLPFAPFFTLAFILVYYIW